ncbi:MAG: single-stranded DNA-binding protein [Flavobacteriales bacterium]|jgi:single-strand DNA-binding protein
MATVNKVILLGNLGRDPETKNFDNGGVVVSFPMATTESYWDKEKAARVDLPTEWHNVRVTRPGLTKLAQFLHKGSQVYIEGSLRTRQYQTKEGETRYFTEVVANEIVITGTRGAGEGNTQNMSMEHSSPAPVPTPVAVGDDDLPF